MNALDVKTGSADDNKDIKEFEGIELVITPKKEFLKWFKDTKGILGDIEIKIKEGGGNVMKCPNCRSIMENHELMSEPNELWHLCTKCNLSFSQRQHRYFTTMIMKLLDES
jgi:hypothetical protein